MLPESPLLPFNPAIGSYPSVGIDAKTPRNFALQQMNSTTCSDSGPNSA